MRRNKKKQAIKVLKKRVENNNNNHCKAFNNRLNNNENKRSSNKKNKNDIDNSDNNDLKDGQNDRLEKKGTFIRTKNWSDLYALKNTSTIRKNNLKQRPGEKKNMAYITPTMDHYSRNGWMGDTDPRSDIYC